MEIKKYPNADLDRYHNIFVEVGLVVALGVCFIAIEWKSKVKEITTLGQVVTPDIESEIIPITRQEQVRPPEPPPPRSAGRRARALDGGPCVYSRSRAAREWTAMPADRELFAGVRNNFV